MFSIAKTLVPAFVRAKSALWRGGMTVQAGSRETQGQPHQCWHQIVHLRAESL
jgi:hypothetical protein